MLFRRFLLILLLVTPSLRAAEPFMPFAEEHCLRCHDAKKQKGQFRLDNLSLDFSDLHVAQKWDEVMGRINSGEMPPEDEPQPTEAEIQAMIGWIATRVKDGEAARMAKRGPVAHYRLSRDEYANTVQDLLGVTYDVNLPGAFNEDPRWHGFERVGSMLSLSPSHVDRYFAAAETVLNRAFPAEAVPSLVRKADAIEMRHRMDRQRLVDMGLDGKVRVPIWPDANAPAWRYYFFPRTKDDGLYKVRIQLSGLPGLDGRAPHLSIWHTTLKKSVYDEDILAPEDKPIIVEFEVFLTQPADLDIRNEVPMTFRRDGNHTLNVLNSGGSVFVSSKDPSTMNPTGYKLIDEKGQAIYPLLLVDWVEFEGPIVTPAQVKKREGLLPASEDVAAARVSLTKFATKAWRRPVLDAEMDRYVKVIENELAAGEKFSAAYRAAMVGILTSKNFYYLEEGSATNRREKVNDWELASRLSYFLWGSMPDDALFDAAQSGNLTKPDVLKSELKRMLADPRIARFTDAFPRQWLQLHKIGMFPPDPKLYPDYDLWLEKSMALEASAYFGEMFAKNLPLRDFLDSDWAMVNPRLANYYKLPPLQSSGFQRVSLRPEDHRGGILTQAGVLMLTSDGTRHRPVHRGVWVSEAIFGKTPPPPPPNVEPLEPTPADKDKATVRNQLEAHATHAACAACHAKIDPLGFAFDNFDAVGQWRTEEVVPTGKGKNPAVNAAGKLPDGRAFSGPEEFKKLMAEDMDHFAEAFVEQLATFALRRVMTVDDTAQIQAIAAASKKDGYKLRTVIENFVSSELFQKR